jgi:hypothetical protein
MESIKNENIERPPPKNIAVDFLCANAQFSGMAQD